MTRCDVCGRPLRRPSPDGLGPVCRRNLLARPGDRGPSTAHPLDHPRLARHGQLTIPVQASFSDCEPTPTRPPSQHRRRRPIDTIPGPDTWPLPGGNDYAH